MYNKIPKNWEKVKLKKYIEIVRGVNYKSNEVYDYKNDNTTGILRANNISNNGMFNFEKIIYVDNKNIKNEQMIKNGDIVIAMSSGSKNLVGKAAQAKQNLNFAFGAFCSVVRPKNINSDFLGFYFLTDYYRNKISELSTGININNLRKDYIENLDIMVPLDPKEQEKIVQVLDTMSNIIRLREKCISHAQDLIPALFQEMFKQYIKQKDKHISIGSVTSDTKQINPLNFFETEFYYIDIASINNDTGIIETPKIININETPPSRARKLVQTNDVIISMTRPYLKGFSIIPKHLDGQIVSTGFSVLRSIPEKISPLYLFAYARTDMFVGQLIPKMKGANYPAVRDSDVRSVKIPLPPIELQEQFAEKVEKINSYIKEQNEELENAKQMFQSLLHHAFTGELTRRAYGKD